MKHHSLFAGVMALLCVNAVGQEFSPEERETYAIACFDGFSMRHMRAACTAKFPNLTGSIETAYQAWRSRNAGALQEISSACQERLAILEQQDAAQFKELREYSERKYAPHATEAAQSWCQGFAETLADPVKSPLPEGLARAVRTAGLPSENKPLPAPKGDRTKPPTLELRLVLESETSDSEALTFISKYQGEQRLHVQKTALLNRKAFKSAKLAENSFDGQPEIILTTTDEGKKLLAQATYQNLGKSIALVLDGKVLIAAAIRSEITGGRLSIKGNYSEPEANTLVRQISDALSQQD